MGMRHLARGFPEEGVFRISGGQEQDQSEGEEEEEGDEDEDEDEDDDLDEDTLHEIGNSDTVPRARLNEVLEENRRLREASAAPAAPAEPAAPAFDLKAKTKERNEKLLEGDIDAASALDDEIAKHHAATAAQSAAAAATQAIMAERVLDAVAEIQRKYPVLNDKKRSFDRDTLDEVVALRNVYIGRGERMDVALRKAAKRICERGADLDDDGERGGGKTKDRNVMTLKQKREAMRRARQQPPATGRHGSSGRPVKGASSLSEEAVARMSDAKFKALDPRDKAEARGDFVGERGKKPRR